jgi:hypothetical protein
VAKALDAGAALLAAALAPRALWRVGVKGDNEPQVSFSTSAASVEALALFRAIGGTVEVDDVVMRLDFDGSAPTHPIVEHAEWLYSWLAAMVF